MDDEVTLDSSIRRWMTLADQYEETCRTPGGPILRAFLTTMLPGDMLAYSRHLSVHGERVSIDTSDLLLFARRPRPDERLDRARVVIDRLTQKIIARGFDADRQQQAADPAVLEAPATYAPDSLLTVAEAGQVANVSDDTIRRACESGRLTARNFGSGGQRLWRIRYADLLQFAGEKKTAAGAKPGGRRQRKTGRDLTYKPGILTAA